MDAAALHERFQADLVEAKRQDREEKGKLFLNVNIPLGKFLLAPLTLERYLFLEQVKSPFLGFAAKEDFIPTKGDVLTFLWIMSPDFRPCPKAGRWFARRNYFIRWKKYVLEIYELIADLMADEIEVGKKQGPKEPPLNWIAMVVDGAASQYGWSEAQIMNLPIVRVKAYMDAMGQRLSGEANGVTFSPRADKVRNEYLKKFEALNKKQARQKAKKD